MSTDTVAPGPDPRHVAMRDATTLGAQLQAAFAASAASAPPDACLVIAHAILNALEAEDDE